MNLIVIASLASPPSEQLAFRTLTLLTETRLKLDNLIEVGQEEKDIYYKWLKVRGLMDFVRQFVTAPERESGIRIDNELSYPLTIKTSRITLDNYIGILGQVGYLATISNNT